MNNQKSGVHSISYLICWTSGSIKSALEGLCRTVEVSWDLGWMAIKHSDIVFLIAEQEKVFPWQCFRGRNFDALLHALNTAPLSTKNQLVKERVVQTVLKVLLTFKSNEIDVAVKSLDQPQLDLLMKYIYRGFEYPSDGSSAQLLTWHEKVFSVGGLGCIIRVLTDRKRVWESWADDSSHYDTLSCNLSLEACQLFYITNNLFAWILI